MELHSHHVALEHHRHTQLWGSASSFYSFLSMGMPLVPLDSRLHKCIARACEYLQRAPQPLIARAPEYQQRQFSMTSAGSMLEPDACACENQYILPEATKSFSL